MLLGYVLGQTGVIIRVKIPNSSKSDNSGVTNILNTSTGLQIGAIADNESTTREYSSLGGTVQGITTLGAYVAPSSGNCRFRQVDPIVHPGVYELQFENSRFAVSGSKFLLVTIAAITALNAAQIDVIIPLVRDDPYVAKPANSNLLNIDNNGYVILQPTGLDFIIEDSYNIKQAIYVSAAVIVGTSSGLPTSPATLKSMDGVTTRVEMAFDVNGNRLSSIITAP